MKIKIITFGKIRDNNLAELEAYYHKLATKHFSIEIVELKDIRDRKVTKQDIEKYLQDGHNLILSEEGTNYSTLEFTNELQKMEFQTQNVNFIIGNAFGFENAIKDKASMILSLSKMTFPHEVVRVLLLEQLFRAGDILAGGKYHK
jgi:23S rRNA (pseudouridine1915-N3)-methyltransferase